MARLRVTGDLISFQVRLTPKGGRDGIDGWAAASDGTEHLKCRVRAVPEDGKANAALLSLLAEKLDVPKSAIRIASGAASRLKRVEITGAPAGLAARLENLT